MRFGICADASRAKRIAEMGFDYIELGLSSVAAMDGAEFVRTRGLLEQAGIRAEAFNVFVPKHIRLTGEGIDMRAVREYLALSLERAAGLGGKTVVFGSGGARNVPEGFPAERAFDQLAEFCRRAGNIAQGLGITIAIEPLRLQECNIINTVDDGVRLLEAASHPAVRVLSDYYHVYFMREGIEPTARAARAKTLCHVHLSHPVTRLLPGPEDDAQRMYRDYFDALIKNGYDGRISLEAGVKEDFEKEAEAALGLMKKYAAG